MHQKQHAEEEEDRPDSNSQQPTGNTEQNSCSEINAGA
jgi:hypothetical protein